jgi:ABC-type uncharacterized transport system permease subunit
MELIQNRHELIYTGLLFGTNFITARIKGYNTYSTWFFLLTITTILFHGMFPDSHIMNFFDKIPIAGIIITGKILFYEKIMKCTSNMYILYVVFVIACYIVVIYLFYYGYLSSSLCFDKNEKIANTYHSLIHLISSIGHHFIILL